MGSAASSLVKRGKPASKATAAQKYTVPSVNKGSFIVSSSTENTSTSQPTSSSTYTAPSLASKGLVDIKEYELTFHPNLGFGSFGQVIRAQHKITKVEVAVKIISFVNGGVKYSDLETLALEEKDKLFSLGKHENVVQMLGYYVDSTSVMLLMELCNLGDLGNYLNKKPDLFDDDKLDILHQISMAIKFLHQNNPPIVHRDIKPGNVLMTDVNGKVYAKVCDFGFARLLDEGASYVNTNSAKGTTVFMAPEMFEKKGEILYSTSADVFSLGLLFLVVWQFSPTNKRLVPFIDNKRLVAFGEQLKEASTLAAAPPILVEISKNDSSLTRKLKRLILRMIALGPKRVTMKQVKRKLASMLAQQQRTFTLRLGQESLTHKVTKDIPEAWSITLINGDIWLCSNKGVDVFSSDLELELLQQIRQETLSWCCSAALLPDGGVVAVRGKGAAVVTTAGTVKKTISTEGYYAVRVHGDKAYMVTYRERDIHVYECEHWVKVHSIAIPCTCDWEGYYHTLVITDRHIIVACPRTDTIYLLRHSGALQSTTGPAIKIMQELPSNTARDDRDTESSTSSTARVYTTTESRLSWPRLCERVDGDAVLVADHCNRRLLVLSAAGEWRRVHLQGKVRGPWDATWANGRLYVIHGSFGDLKLITYS